MFCSADGNPAGMAELEFRDAAAGQLAYFGLMPDFVGRGLGYFFIHHAVSARLVEADLQPAHQHLHAGPSPAPCPFTSASASSPTPARERYIELP